MDEQVFLVGVVLGLVVHEGGVLQQPQSVGGDAAAQPGGRGRGLGSPMGGSTIPVASSVNLWNQGIG